MDLDSPSQSDGQLANGHSGLERVSISWRGDGKYFATNARGAITVWEREGCVLHARAEAVSQFLAVYFWDPRCNLGFDGCSVKVVHARCT